MFEPGLKRAEGACRSTGSSGGGGIWCSRRQGRRRAARARRLRSDGSDNAAPKSLWSQHDAPQVERRAFHTYALEMLHSWVAASTSTWGLPRIDLLYDPPDILHVFRRGLMRSEFVGG